MGRGICDLSVCFNDVAGGVVGVGEDQGREKVGSGGEIFRAREIEHSKR